MKNNMNTAICLPRIYHSADNYSAGWDRALQCLCRFYRPLPLLTAIAFFISPAHEPASNGGETCDSEGSDGYVSPRGACVHFVSVRWAALHS